MVDLVKIVPIFTHSWCENSKTRAHPVTVGETGVDISTSVIRIVLYAGEIDRIRVCLL